MAKRTFQFEAGMDQSRKGNVIIKYKLDFFRFPFAMQANQLQNRMVTSFESSLEL